MENLDDLQKRAREYVEEVKAFYSHLMVYIVVNAGLFAIDYITSPDQLWFYWPLFGWGIGLAMHFFRVFVVGDIFGNNWEKRKIQGIHRQA